MIKFLRSRVSRVFQYVLFPFDLRDLMESLRKRGYEIVELPTPLPSPSARVGGTGPIARKGEYLVYVDTDRQIIGVEGNVPAKNIIAHLKELDKILTDDLNVNVSESTRYCETIINMGVESENPIGELKGLFKDTSFISEASKIIGEDTALVGFRLGSGTRLSTEETWFDVLIRPRWTSPTKYYVISIVYRDKNEKRVEKFMEGAEEKVLNLLKLVKRT